MKAKVVVMASKNVAVKGFIGGLTDRDGFRVHEFGFEHGCVIEHGQDGISYCYTRVKRPSGRQFAMRSSEPLSETVAANLTHVLRDATAAIILVDGGNIDRDEIGGLFSVIERSQNGAVPVIISLLTPSTEHLVPSEVRSSFHKFVTESSINSKGIYDYQVAFGIGRSKVFDKVHEVCATALSEQSEVASEAVRGAAYCGQ